MESYESYRLFFLGNGVYPEEKSGITLLTARGMFSWLTDGQGIRKPAGAGCTAACSDDPTGNQLALLLASILERS